MFFFCFGLVYPLVAPFHSSFQGISPFSYWRKVNHSPTPWNGGIFRSGPDIRVDVSPTRGTYFWGLRESIYQIVNMRNFTFSLQRDFMVDVRFELSSVLGEIRAYLGSPQSQKVTLGNSC